MRSVKVRVSLSTTQLLVPCTDVHHACVRDIAIVHRDDLDPSPRRGRVSCRNDHERSAVARPRRGGEGSRTSQRKNLRQPETQKQLILIDGCTTACASKIEILSPEACGVFALEQTSNPNLRLVFITPKGCPVSS